MKSSAGSATGQASPEYFQRVSETSRRLWDQLESDPSLAGPWRQLFAQVQSPRHVVSELLQNADDACASFASVRIEGDSFIFEHDGIDFDETSFASLCRFGYSNKRTLHTIGFRGIGFKSTFSLGDPVFVTTPSLSFRFDRTRFTQPKWVDTSSRTTVTRVEVRISTPERRAELETNIEEWSTSAASLLFFRSIKTLDLAGTRISRRIIGAGPVKNSEWIELGGPQPAPVLLIRSEEAPFPEDAIREIRSERNSGDDFEIPPCNVEVVLGLSGDQRLYVVLPTGVRPALPFSCNAPFIQDPARFAIKDPSTSPTNRWLLARVGTLAAHTMRAWLGNGDLEIKDLVEAYALLPHPRREAYELSGTCAKLICDEFERTLAGEHILVTTERTLSTENACIAPPAIVYDVWNTGQIKEWLGGSEGDLLAPEVDESARRSLVAWGWLSPLSEASIVSFLAGSKVPPPPDDFERLLQLWSWVQAYHRHDFEGILRRRLHIVPAVGSNALRRADELVRLPASSDALRSEDLAFLAGLVGGIDRDWLGFLSEGKQAVGGASPAVQSALQLLSDIGLAAPSPAEKIVGQAATRLFAQKPTVADAVQLTHIAAALDTTVTSDFCYLNRKAEHLRSSKGVVLDEHGHVEAVMPPQWSDSHLLHEQYFSDSKVCDQRTWLNWARSPKSRLVRFATPEESRRVFYSYGQFEAFLDTRGAARPYSYPYRKGYLRVEDYDFHPELLDWWNAHAENDTTMWMRIVELLTRDASAWCSKAHAKAHQHGREYLKPVHCGPIPASWLLRLRQLRCLPDTYRQPREPAELLMRTPDTEPLLGVEPFVASDLDQPSTKQLLSLLGVRDTPTDAGKLLDRIRALATVTPVPLNESAKWLGALDRLVARSDPARLQTIRNTLNSESLIPTKDDEWAKLGEVFRLGGEEPIPGLALVHPVVATLPMWKALGMAEEPDEDRIVEWVRQFATGKSFDSSERTRVKAFLARCPVRIWNEIGHWLTLDGSWIETDDIRFHLTRKPDKRASALFPHLKAAVADLSMVPRDVPHPALSCTTELNSVIEYRLSDQSTPDPSDGEARDWITTLGCLLARVVIKEQEQHARIVAAAKRLSRSVFHHVPGLCVIPYIQNTPAGEAVTVRALWSDLSLLVTDAAPGRYSGPLIDELARVFGDSQIADAIRSCIDRDTRYIEEYVQEHFELAAADSVSPSHTYGTPAQGETDATLSPPQAPIESDSMSNRIASTSDSTADEDIGDEKETSKGDDGSSRVPGDADDNLSSEATRDDTAVAERDRNHTDRVRSHHSYVNSRATSPPRLSSENRQARSRHSQREPGGPTFITHFARSHQFAWNDSEGLYEREDRQTIRPAEGPFQWEWFDGRQNIVWRLWVAEQRLDTGVEIDTQVWDSIKERPHAKAVVLIGEDGAPRLVPARTLTTMVEMQQLTVYPSTYRLRSSIR